jgi:hypothetical protein
MLGPDRWLVIVCILLDLCSIASRTNSTPERCHPEDVLLNIISFADGVLRWPAAAGRAAYVDKFVRGVAKGSRYEARLSLQKQGVSVVHEEWLHFQGAVEQDDPTHRIFFAVSPVPASRYTEHFEVYDACGLSASLSASDEDDQGLRLLARLTRIVDVEEAVGNLIFERAAIMWQQHEEFQQHLAQLHAEKAPPALIAQQWRERKFRHAEYSKDELGSSSLPYSAWRMLPRPNVEQPFEQIVQPGFALETLQWEDISMTLMLRSCASFDVCGRPYERDLRPSLLSFSTWKRVPVLVVLDHEDDMGSSSSNPNVSLYSSRPRFCKVKVSLRDGEGGKEDPTIWNFRGHERQKYTHLHADLYTDKEFVGFIDTDSLFITPVTPGNLFDSLWRPIVIAQVGKPDSAKFWRIAPQLTDAFLKLKNLGRAMAFFPLIVKKAHLKSLRLYVEHIHQRRSFAEVFREHCANPRCSHFDVIITLLRAFCREDYDWHFQQRDPLWSPSPILGQVHDYSFLTAANTRPVVRVAARVGRDGDCMFGQSLDRDEVTLCVQRQIVWGYCTLLLWPHGSSGKGGNQLCAKGGGGGGNTSDRLNMVKNITVAACTCVFGHGDDETRTWSCGGACEGRECSHARERALRGLPREHGSLFRFENSDWRWDKRCTDAEEDHLHRICFSVAQKGWTWGGGQEGARHSDSDFVEKLLFHWAEDIRNGDSGLYSYTHSKHSKCQCHLPQILWPFVLADTIVYYNCDPPMGRVYSWCEMYDRWWSQMQTAQVYVPEFMDAMSTNLVLSPTLARKPSSETKGSMQEHKNAGEDQEKKQSLKREGGNKGVRLGWLQNETAWEADSAAFYPDAIDNIQQYNEKGWYAHRV